MPVPNTLRSITSDGRLLFVTRFTRLFAYGSLSVILVFYLVSLGLSESQTGLLLSLTLAGDVLVSLFLTTRADRIGRRRMLIAGAALMAGAGVAFACTRNFLFLVIAGTIGVISPSGHEVGPFLSIEQAALSEVVSPKIRTEVFAWYTLAASLATALGALGGGTVTHVLQKDLMSPVNSYRVVVIAYAVLGIILAILFSKLTSAAEVRRPQEEPAALRNVKNFFGVSRSHRVVLKLSSLFALDSFGGGFVVQSFAAYWFYLRFGVSPATLGAIFFWANVFAGISALLASRLALRIGLVRTMVYTHLPSNLLLIAVPLMPTLTLAIAVLLIRFSISQMDVPTRQSYTMAVVSPEERSAAAGLTGVARTTGAAVSPLFAGLLFARPSLINVPFFLAGALKIAYDLLLYRAFAQVAPPEEAVNPAFKSANEKSKAYGSLRITHNSSSNQTRGGSPIPMKNLIWILIVAIVVCSLTWGYLELREGGYFSSYAAEQESPAPSQTAGASFTYNFDSDGVGAMPAKFHSARTGQGAASKWEVMADPSAPSKPNVVAQMSTDKTDYRFPLLIADEGSFKDLELSVKFKAVSGEVDRAGGLVFRLKDANNYYIVRANALENNYRLYHVVAGRRRQFASANFKVTSGEWHELKVECIGNKIICYYDGSKKIEATDTTFKDAGKVGLWTKADSVTNFDDLQATAK